MVSTLVLIHFGRPRLRQTIKNFRPLIQRYAQFWFFVKWSGTSLPNIFCIWFLKKSISSCYTLIESKPIKFHCLVAFTSWDICQYVCCNYLLSSLWHINFEINDSHLSSRLIKPFFNITKSQDKNITTSWTKRTFKMK